MNQFFLALFLIFFAGAECAWPAAEPTVSTQKGPLRLDLTLSSSRYRMGSPIWFRARITNIRKKSISELSCRMAADKDAFANELQENTQAKSGLYLIAQDAKGGIVTPYFEHGPIDGCPEDWNSGMDGPFREVKVPPEIQAKVQKRADELRKQGLDPNQISEALDREYPIPSKHKESPCSGVTLKTGQFLQTPAWVFKGFCAGDRPAPPTPPGDFAELLQFKFKKPGIYRIFAVYKKDPLSSFGPLRVHMVTPPIQIEMLP